VSKDAAGNPTAKFVVVGMVEQAGTGASAAAPMVRAVYNGLFGVGQPAALPLSAPVSTLPKLTPVSVQAQPLTPGAPTPTRVALGTSLDPLIATPAARIGPDR